MKKRISAIFLVAIFVLSALLSACGAAVTLESIAITKTPKTEYVVGEALDLSGGELTATYSDKTTQTVSLTDPSVTVQRPNMNTAGEKTVSVTYNSKSATFKVTVSEPKLTVTFDHNYEGSTPTTLNVENGGTVSEPAAPSRDGYTFLGWFAEKEGTAKYNFATPITSDVTVYAHWGFEVVFNLNYEGAAAGEKVLVEIGGKVAEPATAPTRPNFLFQGWYTSAAATGDRYDFSAEVTANLNLYAGWKEVAGDLYNVTFKYNNGTPDVVRQVEDGSTIDRPADPQMENAEFKGWFSDEALEHEYNFAEPVKGDITLYAKWDVESYTLTFYYNHSNNSGVYTTQSVKPGRQASAPDNPTLDGFYFAGWYEDAACTAEKKVNFPVRNVNSFMNFYAKWLKEWEFQAEYTDFADREAFGYSANGTGASAFIMHNNAEAAGAHNGYWVANLHHKGLFVEFKIDSDAEVFDAALVLRLSADFYDIVLDKTNFEITVNGTVIDYSFSAAITGAVAPDQGGIQNKRPFDNWEFLSDLHLIKGENTIRFTMLDEKKYGEVGTMNATAPMMDSIYVNTNANLKWGAGFPLLSNV